jgi:hypothetical protein
VLRDNNRRNQHHYCDKTILPQNIAIDPKIHRQLLGFKISPDRTAHTCKPAAIEILPMAFGGPIDN